MVYQQQPMDKNASKDRPKQADPKKTIPAAQKPGDPHHKDGRPGDHEPPKAPRS